MATIKDGYPLDPTGASPNNSVKGELHTFINKRSRVFALNYGAFFAHTLKLVDRVTKVPLRPDQFFMAYRNDFASAQYDADVVALVVITDEAVGLQVLADYQAIGGIYSYAGEQLAKVVKAAMNVNRSINWGPVVEPHDVVVENQYKHWPIPRIGFEHATFALSRLRETIKYGDIASYRAVGTYAKNRSALFPTTARSLFEAVLAKHGQKGNPHPQYVLRSMLDEYLPWVITPTNVLPRLNQTGVPRLAQLQGSVYRALSGVALKRAVYHVSTNPSMAGAAEYISGNANGMVVPVALQANTRYYWRVRYESAENQTSNWSQITDFVTAP